MARQRAGAAAIGRRALRSTMTCRLRSCWQAAASSTCRPSCGAQGARVATIGIPGSGPRKLWVNGALAVDCFSRRPLRPNYNGDGEAYAQVDLRPGLERAAGQVRAHGRHAAVWRAPGCSHSRRPAPRPGGCRLDTPAVGQGVKRRARTTTRLQPITSRTITRSRAMPPATARLERMGAGARGHAPLPGPPAAQRSRCGATRTSRIRRSLRARSTPPPTTASTASCLTGTGTRRARSSSVRWKRAISARPTATGCALRLMWANHDWVDIFPGHGGQNRQPCTIAAPSRRPRSNRLTDYVIQRYFRQPAILDARRLPLLLDLRAVPADRGPGRR